MFISCGYDINYKSCQKAPLRMKCNLNALNIYPNRIHNISSEMNLKFGEYWETSEKDLLKL